MQPGANNFFGVKVSKAGIPVNQASDKQLVYKDDFSTKTYYDATTARMLEGKLPDGSYGMWVSKPGFDVTTATSDQLVFNSNQDIFKIVKKITSVVPAFATTYNGSRTFGSNILTIPHGQAFAPIIQVYVQGQLYSATLHTVIASAYIPVPVYATDSFNAYFFPNQANNSFYILTILYAADNTNIYVQAQYNALGNFADTIGDIPTTIFIMQETAVP